jgi:hAT family C-terminal dimerisation region
MACDYSTILASSVLSKAVFGIAELQITKRRNRLAPKTIGVIMCLRSWGLIKDAKDDDFDKDTNDNNV